MNPAESAAKKLTSAGAPQILVKGYTEVISAEYRSLLTATQEALEEIGRITSLLLHQNNGRWNPDSEHEMRAKNVSERTADIASSAIARLKRATKRRD